MFKYQAFLRSVFCSEFRSRGVGCSFFSLSPPFFSLLRSRFGKDWQRVSIICRGKSASFFSAGIFQQFNSRISPLLSILHESGLQLPFFSSITLYKRERKEYYVDYVSKAIKLFLFSEWLNQEFMFLVNHLHFYLQSNK